MTCNGETHYTGCPCHEANWREQLRLLAATKDARIADLELRLAERDAEIDRMRQQLSQARDVISKNGCDCDCDHDPGDHDADCDECLACRVAMALNGGENV